MNEVGKKVSADFEAVAARLEARFDAFLERAVRGLDGGLRAKEPLIRLLFILGGPDQPLASAVGEYH